MGRENVLDGVFKENNNNYMTVGLEELQLFVNEMTATAFKTNKQNKLIFVLIRWSKQEPYWCVFACECGNGSISGINGMAAIGGHFCIGKEECFHNVLDILTKSDWKIEIHAEYFMD